MHYFPATIWKEKENKVNKKALRGSYFNSTNVKHPVCVCVCVYIYIYIYIYIIFNFSEIYTLVEVHIIMFIMLGNLFGGYMILL